ncbi:MAG: helix-turn-helix domain-containing protein [Clostridia bacterium]
MDLQRLTIGQMARLNHISEQTLRLYDRNHLLTPAYTDEMTGYRYYHIGQSARLDMIQYLKASGMTLKQIKEVFSSDNPVKLQKLLNIQLRAIDREIGRLSKARAAVTRNLENYQKYEVLPKNGNPFFEFIGKRQIYRYTCDENFFDQDDAGYEYMLRKLKQHLVHNDIPLSYFSNIGTIIRKSNLENNALFSNEVFMFVDDNDVSPDVETIASGMYLCICSDDFYAESENANRLLTEIRQRSYRIIGDYLCEVIMDFPAFEFNKRKMFYKIQIPVAMIS